MIVLSLVRGASVEEKSFYELCPWSRPREEEEMVESAVRSNVEGEGHWGRMA